VLATLMFCAAAMNFSWIQSWHNSDTVIPALISIEKYSLFYWSENRFGMLVPLLTSVVRDYGWNLLIQSQLIVMAGISAVVLIDLLAFDAAARSVRTTLAASLLLLFYKPQAALVLLLPGSPYLVGLALVLGALCLLLRITSAGLKASLVGGILLLLGFWVNPSNLVMAIAAVMLWPRRHHLSLRLRVGILAMIIGTAGIVMAVSKLFPGTDVRAPLPLTEWPASLMKVLGNIELTMHGTVLTWTLAAAAVVMAFRFRKGHYESAHALAIASIGQIVLTSGLRWVALNNYDSRYIAGPVLVLAMLALLILVQPVADALLQSAGAAAATLVCCFIALIMVIRVFGFPSARQALTQISHATSDVGVPRPELGCTHIIGNYWYAWETVFNDRLISKNRRVWAVSFRSDATRDAWTAIPTSDRRYCAVCSDAQIELIRSQEGVGQLTKETEVDGICVFREVSK
jgi:hypothetical protein